MFTITTAGDRQHTKYMQHMPIQIHYTSEVFGDETDKWVDIDMTIVYAFYLKTHKNH
jgi:hypothetical protein